MAIPINKEHREIAKKDNSFLFQLALDGRHLVNKESEELEFFKMRSRFEVTGALPVLAAKELWDWYLKWQDEI